MNARATPHDCELGCRPVLAVVWGPLGPYSPRPWARRLGDLPAGCGCPAGPHRRVLSFTTLRSDATHRHLNYLATTPPCSPYPSPYFAPAPRWTRPRTPEGAYGPSPVGSLGAQRSRDWGHRGCKRGRSGDTNSPKSGEWWGGGVWPWPLRVTNGKGEVGGVSGDMCRGEVWLTSSRHHHSSQPLPAPRRSRRE